MYLDSPGIYVPDVKQRNYPKTPKSRCKGAMDHWRRKNWEKVEKYWVKQSQKSLQDRLKKGELQQLSLFTDNNGIIRVGGQVDKALVSYETKHPAMLPQDRWISLLITQHFHQIGYAGVATTVVKIRTKFWIIRAHDLAKSVKFQCVTAEKLRQELKHNSWLTCPELAWNRSRPHFITQHVITLGLTK